MNLNSLVGAPSVPGSGDGATPPLRAGRMNDLIMSELHGRYYESNSRGNMFSIAVSAYTVVITTDISPLPANTGVPLLGVFNPVGNKFNVSIVGAIVSTTSGNPGGPYWWNVIPSPAGITATGSSPVSMSNFNAAGSTVKAFAAAAITGSAVAATALRPLGGPAAIAAGAGINSILDEPAGSIIVPPGAFCGIAFTAAGTTHVVSGGLWWEEIPF